LTAAIALAAIAQTGIACWQVCVYRRQAKLMVQSLAISEKSAEAAVRSNFNLEKLERPFLIIELRGLPQHEVWAVNKGRVPAQIIWHNPEGRIIFPDRDKMDELPPNFDYGQGYYMPNTEQFNIPWIPPGGEIKVATCEFIATNSDIAADIQNGRKAVLILSGLKYRGMLNDSRFESRWCFRHWGRQRNLTYSGPHGYNSYT
jgi:hypothetical protein